ncbi:hypothetical protein FS837_000235, partial [Tulasnella sp. UAMH 9824]
MPRSEAKEIEVSTSTNFDCSKWIEAKFRSLSTTVGKWLFRDGKPFDLEAESAAKGPNVLENYVMLNNQGPLHPLYDGNQFPALVEVTSKPPSISFDWSKWVEVGAWSKEIEISFDNFELRGITSRMPFGPSAFSTRTISNSLKAVEVRSPPLEQNQGESMAEKSPSRQLEVTDEGRSQTTRELRESNQIKLSA